jgi:hypothetical protein
MSAYMSKSINFSGYSSASLTFWYKIPGIESGIDKLRVYIDSTIVWERSSAQASWTQVALSLNSYVGGSHTLKFEFYSDSSVTGEGAYLDDILVTATAPSCTEDGYEQDDTSGTAKAIADGETQNRAICTAGDEDWATFTISVAGSGVLARTGARAGLSGGDTEMWLYGPNNAATQVAYNDDAYGLWSEVTAAGLATGTYWLRVRELGNNATIQGYTLFLDITPPPCTEDGYEQDDTSGTAKAIADGETQNRAICTAGDEDWATFTISVAGSGVLARTGARAGLSGGDTEMWLYGPNNAATQVAYNDDAYGLWSEVTAAGLATGTYWLRVRELGNNATIQGYTLFLDITPPPCTEDGYEQDDTSGTAKAIADGETQNRAICTAGDQDWARFTLSGPGDVLIRTASRAGYVGGDTELWLYGPNSSTTQIAYNDDYTGLWSQISVASLPAGTYYVKVQEYGNNGTIDGYTLFLDITTPTLPPDAYESDDTAGASKTISDNETQNRDIHVAGNEDWARFTLTQNSDVLVRTGARGGFAGGDTVMWLYGPNSSTAQIGYNDDSSGLWSQITAANLAPGTYYVRIQEYGNNGTIDGYTLYLDITQAGLAPDAYEADDTAGAAKTISDGETQNRNVHVAGNEDWARFTLTQNSDVLVRTGARGGFAGGDTVMWLYGPNSSTAQIGYNDDSSGLWSQITAANLAPGTYYVRIQEYGNNGTIDGYTLFLDATPVAITGDAYEPDNTPADAKVINDAETQNRSIHLAGNVDWTRFTLTGPSDVLLRTGPRAGFAGGDTVMWLYGPNSSATQVAYNDDASGVWSQITAANLPPGTYYIRIEEYGNNGTIDGYTLFLDTTPVAITGDAYEPDNTPADAKVITDGETQNRSIHLSGNEDWARFTLAGPSDVVLRTGPRSGFVGGDTVMWLYGPNSSATQVAYNDDASGVWSQITAASLPPGTYYVRIQEYGNNGTIDGYTLFLDATAVVITGDTYEPDNTSADSKLISDGETQNRSIHLPGNVDWARFTLGGPSDVLLRTGPRTGFSGGDTVMWLYGPNSAATQVAYNDDTSGAWSQITAANLPAGTYYVRVEEYGNNGTIDGYTLFLDVTGVAPPTDDHGNTIADATGVSVNSTTQGNIEVAGDIDYYRLTLASAGRLSVYTTGQTDTYGYLKDASGNNIVSDDDGAGSGNFRITRDLAAGIYYVAVRHYRSTGMGAYQLVTAFSQPMEPPLLQLANRLSQGVTDFFANQYQNDHRKWLFSVSVGGHLTVLWAAVGDAVELGPSAGAVMNVDLADYLSVTPEGRDGYLTVWLEGALTVLDVGRGIPIVNFGAAPIDFDVTEPDPRRSFSISLLSGTLPVAGFALGSWDSDSGFSTHSGAWEVHSEAVLSLLEISKGLYQFEVHRLVIDAATTTALNNGLLSPVAPLTTIHQLQQQLVRELVEAQSGSFSGPFRRFTGKDDGTHVDNTAVLEHFAIKARDGSWIENLTFPTVPDLFGIPLVGWETGVRVRNVGNNTSHFFVKALSWPAGWNVGANDGGVLTPLLDHKWDFQLIAGQVVDLPFVVAPTSSAADGRIVFELWHDGLGFWANTLLDTRSFAVRVQRP